MKNFLVGNFLPAYASAYRMRNIKPSEEPDFEPEEKRRIFEERAKTHRTRRLSYGRRIQIGLIAALGITILGFRIPLKDSETKQITLAAQEIVEIAEIQQTKQKTLPPPPPRPPIPLAVPDDEILDDFELELDAALDLDQELEVPMAPPPAPEEEVEEEVEPEIFVAVEQMPVLIGGKAALMDAVVYPEMAIMAGLEGTVVVQIVVQPDGVPSDPVVVKSVADVLDNAAIEAVMKQRFEPGRQRNVPVPVRMAMPVKFQLRKSS